jgi:hypothetical protein
MSTLAPSAYCVYWHIPPKKRLKGYNSSINILYKSNSKQEKLHGDGDDDDDDFNNSTDR